MASHAASARLATFWNGCRFRRLKTHSFENGNVVIREFDEPKSSGRVEKMLQQRETGQTENAGYDTVAGGDKRHHQGVSRRKIHQQALKNVTGTRMTASRRPE